MGCSRRYAVTLVVHCFKKTFILLLPLINSIPLSPNPVIYGKLAVKLGNTLGNTVPPTESRMEKKKVSDNLYIKSFPIC